MKELNVIGTMQLLAACQRAPSVRRFVLKSTSAVYGASLARPRRVHRGRCRPRAVPVRRLRQGQPRHRGLRPRLRAGAVPTSTSRRCGSPTSSVRGSTPCSPASSACRSCRPRSATTPGCSCCTRTTPWRCSPARRPATSPARSTSAARARCCSPRPSAGSAASRCRCPTPGAGLGRPAVPPLRLRRLLARADALPQLRPRRRHHGAARGVRLHPALHDGGRVGRLRPHGAAGGLAAAGRVGDRPGPRRCLERGRRRRRPRSASGCGPAPPAPGLRAVRDA